VLLEQKKRLEGTSWGIEGILSLPGLPVVFPYQDMGYKITNIDTGKSRIISISGNDPFLKAIAIAQKQKSQTGHAGPLYMAVKPAIVPGGPKTVQYLEPMELKFGEFFKPGGGFLAPPKLAEGQATLILNCRIEEVIQQKYNSRYDPKTKKTILKPAGKVVSEILKCFDQDGNEVPELMSRPGDDLYKFLMKGCEEDATECGPFLYDGLKGTLAPHKEQALLHERNTSKPLPKNLFLPAETDLSLPRSLPFPPNNNKEPLSKPF
jgi:hypothetical protein